MLAPSAVWVMDAGVEADLREHLRFVSVLLAILVHERLG